MLFTRPACSSTRDDNVFPVQSNPDRPQVFKERPCGGLFWEDAARLGDGWYAGGLGEVREANRQKGKQAERQGKNGKEQIAKGKGGAAGGKLGKVVRLLKPGFSLSN